MARPSCPPAELLARGRGLLALDQPRRHVEEMLRQARVPVTMANAAGMRALVLNTPGLDRLVSGVLLDPATLRAVHDQDEALPALLRTGSVAVGVRMGDETGNGLHLDPDAARMADDIAAHAGSGATFARWRLVADEDTSTADIAARARTMALWAAMCSQHGMTPLVECAVRAPARHGLDAAERLHTAALGTVMSALRARRIDPADVLLGVSLVAPGHRTAASCEDIARATVRSLRNAGVGAAAGVAVTPAGSPRHLTTHLAAVQWMGTGRPLGFCLGRSLLAPVARAWRGRADRVPAAQHELRSRLTCTVAVAVSRT